MRKEFAVASILFASIAFSGASTAGGDQAGLTVYGAGNIQCKVWQGTTLSDASKEAVFSWSLGYLTGVADAGAPIQAATNAHQLTEFHVWLNNYCHDHPGDSVALAAHRLAQTLTLTKRD